MLQARVRRVDVYISLHHMGSQHQKPKFYLKAAVRQHFGIGKRNVTTRKRDGRYLVVAADDPYFMDKLLEGVISLVRDCYQKLSVQLGEVGKLPPISQWTCETNIGDYESEFRDFVLNDPGPNVLGIGKI